MSREPQPSVDDYDDAWPLRFEDLAATIRKALGIIVLRIEHVGSTAVPGLAAKPVIDLDVVVRSAHEMQLAILRLAQIGYAHEGELGIAGRAAFRSPPGRGSITFMCCLKERRNCNAIWLFATRCAPTPHCGMHIAS
ncbi:MAG TPA: GrpB family protein [Terracidiphilus sp.]|jgi:GrpB-like predicted nucleotidyltransferase (UPF0157 family)